MQEVIRGLISKYDAQGYHWSFNPDGRFKHIKNEIYVIQAEDTALRFMSGLARFWFRNDTTTDKLLHYHVPADYLRDHKEVMGKMRTEHAGKLITDIRAALQPSDCKEGMACAVVSARWDVNEISDFIDAHIIEQQDKK